MPRSVVAIALPRPEFLEVDEQLNAAGYECIAVQSATDLDGLLASRQDVNVAILDCETDFDRTLEMYDVLRENGGRFCRPAERPLAWAEYA